MLDTPPRETHQETLPASLRFLKGLVITLMITMILGVITVVWVLVTRMPDGRAQIPTLPADITLPKGELAQAITFGQGWVIVVTQTQNLLIFDSTGALVQSQALGDLSQPN